MNSKLSESCLRYGVTGLAAIGVLAAAACSSSGGGKPSSSSTGGGSSSSSSPVVSGSPSPSAPTSSGGNAPSDLDLTATLINPADIPADTFTLKSADPISQSGAVGVDGEFANADGSRTVTDVVVWFPTDSEADTALTAEQTSAAGQLKAGGTHSQITLGGSSGTPADLYAGNDAHGAATIILFQDGNYVVTLEFNSKTGDDIPAALATGVATAQDTKVAAAS